jgi:hypothetical protein
MSQTTHLLSKALEMQQDALERSQRTVEQAAEIPIRQTVELQRNAAELFLDGLETGNYLQNRGVELTRDVLDRVEDPNGDRVKITLDGKFLPYKRW